MRRYDVLKIQSPNKLYFGISSKIDYRLHSNIYDHFVYNRVYIKKILG